MGINPTKAIVKPCPAICFTFAYMTCPSSGDQKLNPACNCCLVKIKIKRGRLTNNATTAVDTRTKIQHNRHSISLYCKYIQANRGFNCHWKISIKQHALEIGFASPVLAISSTDLLDSHMNRLHIVDLERTNASKMS